MYINFIMDQNKIKYVSYWLLLHIFLVGFMIFVGGLTRLTDSGLSITEWNLISGIIPPLDKSSWDEAFFLYKKIPEYRLINSNMTLEEFKIIYWWEYIHRLLGRIIGLVFVVPLIFFSFKKYINYQDLISFSLIFLLICFQGFIGWYMVQSGLLDRVDVSHYRLSLHLTLAFIILSLLLWNYLKIKNHEPIPVSDKLPNWLLISFLVLIILQISLGALVSGLDAGKIYQSWPLMNDNYFPNDSKFIDLFSLKVFEQASLVQFTHRNLAYLIFFIFLIISYLTIYGNRHIYIKKAVLLVMFALVVQITLGIFTILSGAHIILSSVHQIGSIFLIAASINLVAKNSIV